MVIISAADAKYKIILEDSLKKTKEAGYDTHVYSINKELDSGSPFSTYDFTNDLIKHIKTYKLIVGKILYKPYLIDHALKQHKQPMVWLDADAHIHKRIDEINFDEFDVGFTLRRYCERNSIIPIWLGFINAGVCFFNYTEPAKKFVSLWKKQLFNTEYLSDQEAINRIVMKVCDFSPDCYGGIFNLDGIRIKIFSTDEYNFYYKEKPKENTKIIHRINSSLKERNKVLR